MPDPGAWLIEQFEAGSRDIATFTHQEHVWLGFEMLRRYPFLEAALRVSKGLRAMATAVGRPGAYHETVKLAFLAVIGERLASMDDPLFEAFAQRNPDLLDRALLRRWYSQDRLDLDLARRTFLLPNAEPQSAPP